MANAEICRIYERYKERLNRYYPWMDICDSDREELSKLDSCYDEDSENLLVFHSDSDGYFAITDQQILTPSHTIPLWQVERVKTVMNWGKIRIAVEWEDSDETAVVSRGDILDSREDTDVYTDMLIEMAEESQRKHSEDGASTQT